MVRALGVMIVRVLRRRRRFGVECVQRAKEGAPFTQRSRAPTNTISASPMALAVAPIRIAATATSTTAVSACNNAEANDSATPRPFPFKTPVKTKALDLEVYDPDFFIDFGFAEKDPAGQCAGAVLGVGCKTAGRLFLGGGAA